MLAKVRVHMTNPVEWMDVDKLKSKFQNIKTNALYENSGFGWDVETGMPIALDEVWDRRYMQVLINLYLSMCLYSSLYTYLESSGSHAVLLEAARSCRTM